MHNAITVHNSRMPLVEYQGLRVVTFSMIDEAHQRPKGTARAAFNRNRHRFTEDRHYFKVSAEKARLLNIYDGIKRTRKKSPISGRATADITLITEMGYLLLVKPFGDDLSWLIQEELVNAYFRHIPQFPELHKVHVPDTAELIEMPLQQAQNLIAEAERESFTQHGQKGSAAMRLRRDELKKLRPATKIVLERVQIEIADMGRYADE